MQIGYIGLGKMGKNMVMRLLSKGHQVVVWNRSQDVVKKMVDKGAISSESISDLVLKLKFPKIIWLMLPSGQVTNEMVINLSSVLSEGDTVIDGSNSFYKDTKNNYQIFGSKKINFVDVGVSGGPQGALNGACLMIGGSEDNFKKLEILYRDLAAENAYQFFGGNGAGHFVKMIHNGIEYGMMQSIAEGFNLLKRSEFALDLKKAADVYNHASVIESRLISWLKDGFSKYGQSLDSILGSAEQSGEGEWTVQFAQEINQPAWNIKSAVDYRKHTQENPSYIGKIISALRNQFGGHSVRK